MCSKMCHIFVTLCDFECERIMNLKYRIAFKPRPYGKTKTPFLRRTNGYEDQLYRTMLLDSYSFLL